MGGLALFSLSLAFFPNHELVQKESQIRLTRGARLIQAKQAKTVRELLLAGPDAFSYVQMISDENRTNNIFAGIIYFSLVNQNRTHTVKYVISTNTTILAIVRYFGMH